VFLFAKAFVFTILLKTRSNEQTKKRDLVKRPTNGGKQRASIVNKKLSTKKRQSADQLKQSSKEAKATGAQRPKSREKPQVIQNGNYSVCRH